MAREGGRDLLMRELYGGCVEGFADGHDLIALMLAHLQGFQEGVGHSFQCLLWPRLIWHESHHCRIELCLLN